MATPAADRKTARNLSQDAGSWVGMALQQGVDYVLTIGANNPPEKVAKRRDVVAALEHAASGGQAKALPILDRAWKAGLRSGGAPSTSDANSEILESLRSDIKAIMAAAAKDMRAAYVLEGEDGLVKAQKRAAYRVSLAVDAAFTYARAGAWLAGGEKGMFKKWVTHSALPCSHCAHLALLPPIPVDEEFPEHVPGLPILSVYADKFLGPPRHPNCQCSLLITSGDADG